MNNTITISGPKSIIETLWNKSMNQQILVAMAADDDYEIWGQEFNFVETDGDAYIEGEFQYHNAPTGVIESFIEQNPNISIHLTFDEESDVDFCGYWQNGDCVTGYLTDIVDKLMTGVELDTTESLLAEEFCGSVEYLMELNEESA